VFAGGSWWQDKLQGSRILTAIVLGWDNELHLGDTAAACSLCVLMKQLACDKF